MKMAATISHIGISSRLITLLWGHCGLFHLYISKEGKGWRDHNCCNVHNCPNQPQMSQHQSQLSQKNTIVAIATTIVTILINHNCRNTNHKCRNFFEKKYCVYYQFCTKLWHFIEFSAILPLLTTKLWKIVKYAGTQ